MPAIAGRSPRRSARRWEARHERARAAHRLAASLVLALVVLALGTWWCASSPSRLTCCRARAWCCATLIADGGLLWTFAAGDARHHLRGLCAGRGRRHRRLPILFSQSRLIEYSLYPYAVILQVTPVVAIAPLLLIYLPQPLAVLACAWIVAFFPVLANTTLGLNSVDHNLIALFELYKALALAGAVESEAAGGAAADARRPAHRRRAVADRRGGGRDRRGLRRRRLRARLSHRRIRLPAQHPAHVRGAAAAVARRRRDLLCAVGCCRISCCAAGTKARSSARDADLSTNE